MGKYSGNHNGVCRYVRAVGSSTVESWFQKESRFKKDCCYKLGLLDDYRAISEKKNKFLSFWKKYFHKLLSAQLIYWKSNFILEITK